MKFGSPLGSYLFPRFSGGSMPVNEVVDMILNHLKLQIKYSEPIHGQSELVPITVMKINLMKSFKSRKHKKTKNKH